MTEPNKHQQRCIEKTDRRSENHRFARIWLVRCESKTYCNHEYEANSCDFWERRCPKCQGGK